MVNLPYFFLRGLEEMKYIHHSYVHIREPEAVHNGQEGWQNLFGHSLILQNICPFGKLLDM